LKNMRTDLFDYHLPEKLIAQKPLENREESRLMVIHRKTGKIEHKKFYQVIDYLEEGDLLILNNTRVIPARLYGRKKTGAKVEFLLLNFLGNNKWKVLVKPGGKLKVGNTIVFPGEDDENLEATIIEHKDDGSRIVEFSYSNEELWRMIEKIGKVPLPPYIKSDIDNPERYQTVYAKEKGAVAAPTAGLHFTEKLLAELKEKGIRIAEITLHVGLGTFRPIKSENIENHDIHGEWFHVPKETVELINKTRDNSKKIVAVGTTVVRTLETIARMEKSSEYSGWTELYIYPPFEFKLVDAMITNFHLPRSSLLVLVSAFASRELILEAYREAVERKYRFFSFGDASLIL